MQISDNLSAQSGLIGAPNPMSIKTVLAAQSGGYGTPAPGPGGLWCGSGRRPRAASGLARPGELRAPSAAGSVGTLGPWLPPLLTAENSSGLAGEEFHGKDTGG